MNLPNRITLTRIALIPVFVVLFYLDVIPNGYQYLCAGIVFVIAAYTDYLDGHIARKQGLVTNLGKFLDPIADKVLVSTALVLMLTKPWIFEVVGSWGLIVAGICIALILARELIISGFRMVAAGQNVVLAADKLGKLKTSVQDVALTVLLVSMTFLGNKVWDIIAIIGYALFLLCTLLTILSGVNYIVRNKQILKS